MKARCMKCKEQQEMVDQVESLTKNNRPIVKGKCKVCGCKMCKIGVKLDANS